MKEHKEYEAAKAYDDMRDLMNKSAELIERIFYGNDAKALEVLIKGFDFMVSHSRMCASCLDFLKDCDNPYNKISLLIGYLGDKGMSENFVSELECMTEEAQSYLEMNECGKLQKEAEEAALENMRIAMDKAEMRAVTEQEY